MKKISGIYGLILAIFAFSVLSGPVQAKGKLKNKLNTVIIKKIELEDADFKNVIKAVRVKAAEADPEGKGINIFVKRSVKDVPKLSLFLNNIPLGELIEAICMAAELDYEVGDYAIMIGREIAMKNVFIRFKFPPEKKYTEKDLKKYFEPYGVEFPKGSSIFYNPKNAKITMHNTPTNINRLKSAIDQLNMLKPNRYSKNKYAAINKVLTCVIPKIDFQEAQMITLLKFLKASSARKDPEKGGLNFVFRPATENITVTSVLNDIPVNEALKYFCKAGAFTFNVLPHSIVVFPQVEKKK
jgi:hypothetical protein